MITLGPRMSCNQGHSICDDCVDKLADCVDKSADCVDKSADVKRLKRHQVKCVTCRGALTSRNIEVENMIEILSIECPHSGCKQRFVTDAELTDHALNSDDHKRCAGNAFAVTVSCGPNGKRTASIDGSGTFRYCPQPISDAIEKTGTLVNSKWQGATVVNYPNGNRYEGQYKDNKRNGKGTFTYSDAKYTGDWDNDSRHGVGTMTYPSGEIYTGQWCDGEKHGKGTVTYPDKWTYDGEWDENVRHGKGELKDPDGTIRYKGDWVNDVRDGHGEEYFENGDTYIGDFDEDRRSGYGTYTRSDGETYTGMWESDEKNGKGKCRWPNGDTYEGQFAHDKRHGQGTEELSSGTVIRGSYKKNKKDGLFSIAYPAAKNRNGHSHQVIEKVQWKDGKQHCHPCVFIKLSKAEV